MDITQDFADANFIITGYKPDCVLINHEAHQKSFIISPDSLLTTWEVTDVSHLNEVTLASIIDNPPEIMLIGTGDILVLPDPKIIALFAQPLSDQPVYPDSVFQNAILLQMYPFYLTLLFFLHA